jgi:hypothetical protein
MIRQCAWCCHVLGLIPPLEDSSVTHGMCLECHRKLLDAQEAAQLPIDQQDSTMAAILSGEISP